MKRKKVFFKRRHYPRRFHNIKNYFWLNYKNNFLNYCKYMNTKYKSNIFIYNKELNQIIDIMKVEYIFIADNPGETERDSDKYLLGKSGKSLRNFIINHLGIEKDKLIKQCIFLNKSCIFSKQTKQLKSKESQKEIVELIKNILSLNSNIIVCFLGVSDIELIDDWKVKPESRFSTFYNSYFNINNVKRKTILYHHPVKGGAFNEKEIVYINQHLEDLNLNDKDKLEIKKYEFLKQGHLNLIRKFSLSQYFNMIHNEYNE